MTIRGLNTFGVKKCIILAELPKVRGCVAAVQVRLCVQRCRAPAFPPR